MSLIRSLSYPASSVEDFFFFSLFFFFSKGGKRKGAKATSTITSSVSQKFRESFIDLVLVRLFLFFFEIDMGS